MEIWKDIEGYEGLYQISSEGRIKALPKPHRYGVKYEKILKQRYDKEGYCRIKLCKNGIKKCFLIHRLVGLAFISNPNNKETINHKNKITNDNRVSNLEWMTQLENNLHKLQII